MRLALDAEVDGGRFGARVRGGINEEEQAACIALWLGAAVPTKLAYYTEY